MEFLKQDSIYALATTSTHAAKSALALGHHYHWRSEAALPMLHRSIAIKMIVPKNNSYQNDSAKKQQSKNRANMNNPTKNMFLAKSKSMV